jgi:hypothetical protein
MNVYIFDWKLGMEICFVKLEPKKLPGRWKIGSFLQKNTGARGIEFNNEQAGV